MPDIDTSTLTLAVLLALIVLALGSVVSWAGFFLRQQRLPAATAYEDIVDRLALAQEAYARKQEELREVEQNIAQRDRFAGEAAALKEQISDLEAQRQNLEPAREEIEQTLSAAADAAEKLASAEQELAGRQMELAAVEEKLKDATRELNPERLDQLRRDKEEVERELLAIRGEFEKLQAEREAALRVIGEAQQHTARVEALKIEEERLSGERTRVRTELDEVRGEVDKARDDLRSVLQQLTDSARKRDDAVAEREQAESERDTLSAKVASLTALLEKLERQPLSTATAGGAGSREPTEDERRAMLADLIAAPACLAMPAVLRGGPRSEAEALHEVRTYLHQSGLRFGERVLRAFHTALKINDTAQITVLAGVSGTGKSLLPRRYSEAMGIHFLQVAVEPRWDSPQDLLGFYNYVEGKYRATELARLLAHLDPWQSIELPAGQPDRRDHVALLLLDEMNLARVEYYFSEFLSRLEARPRWREGLTREDGKDALIPVDIRGLSNAPSLFPAHNILFVGTMNDDESTQSLSDKVLDRGNVLQFPAPSDFSNSPQVGSPPVEAGLSFRHWRSWIRPAEGLDGPQEGMSREVISELADIMEGFGRPFGHRLNQSIRQYVANYPRLGHGSIDVRPPLADQIETRILPKLRGLEVQNHQRQFDDLEKLISERLDDQQLSKRLEETRMDQEQRAGLFVWRGLEREE